MVTYEALFAFAMVLITLAALLLNRKKSKKVLTNKQKGSIIKGQREADDGCSFRIG